MSARHSAAFRERFCERFKCDPEDFERRMLFACLYWHAGLLGRLFYYVDRRYFFADLLLVRQLGVTEDLDEFVSEVRAYRSEGPPHGLLQRFLRLRMSGRRAIELATRLFAGKIEQSVLPVAAKTAAAPTEASHH